MDALNRESIIEEGPTLTDDNLKDEVKKLLEEVKVLQALKFRLVEKESNEYNEKRNQIREVFDEGDVIVSTISGLNAKIATVKLVAEIGGLANPTSVELTGKSFIDNMFELATSILLKDMPPENKVKPSSFLASLIQSPFVKGLLESTPVGAVVNGIIGAIKSRAETILGEGLNLEKPLKRLGDLKLATEDTFKKEKVQAFESKLQDYIAFYDGFRETKQNLENQLDILSLEIQNLKNNSSKFYTTFLNDLGLSSNNSTLLEKKFPSIAPSVYTDLISLLTNEAFKSAYAKRADYLEIKIRANKLESDFQITLNTYVQKITSILTSFAKTQEGEAKSKIERKAEELVQKAKEVLGSN